MNERVSITQGLSPRRRAYDIVMRTLLYASAAIICALLIFLIGYILYRGIPSLSWEFLTSEESVINDVPGHTPRAHKHALHNHRHADIHPAPRRRQRHLPHRVRHEQEAGLRHRVRHRDALRHAEHHLRASSASSCSASRWAWARRLIAGAFSLVMMTLPTIIRTTQESPQDRAAELPRGLPRPRQRQVAHDPHRRPALAAWTASSPAASSPSAASSARAPSCMFTAGMSMFMQNYGSSFTEFFKNLFDSSRRHAHGRAVRLRQGARRLRPGLRRGRRAAGHRVHHQHRREAGGQKARRKH